MKIFEFDDYKRFVAERIGQMPARGRGEFRKLSKALKIHSSRVSQIFRGDMHPTPEQACELARYLGLDDLETEYLLVLVQRDRAGSSNLRGVLEKQLKQIRGKSHELFHRVEKNRVLTEEEKSTFYSNWYYSGVRLAAGIPALQSLDAIAKYFDLPRNRVRSVLDFLLQSGLCEEQEGKFTLGPKLTHLESGSPLVSRHHSNWRIKAMQKQERLDPIRELAYTAPMVLSVDDCEKVREMTATFIQNILKVVKESTPNEKLYCLCLDWFEF